MKTGIRGLGWVMLAALLMAWPALDRMALGQGPPPLAIRLAGMTAVTGYEQAMTDSLLSLLPGAKRDRAGNVILTIGTGEPRRLVACPIDEPGYVVGDIRADGYLTLRRTPGRPVPPLFDQQMEGQPVSLYTARGVVPGVVAVRSTHLTRGRSSGPEDPFTVDGAYVDVGAASRAEIAALGIRVLTPVTLAKRPHRYGDDLFAAPVAGQRAACAALLSAARQQAVGGGTVVVAFLTKQNLAMQGLYTVGHAEGPFRQTLITRGSIGPLGAVMTAPDTTELPALGDVSDYLLPVRFPDTAVETVSLADVAALERKLLRWMGGAE